jgi:hypothetical protein
MHQFSPARLKRCRKGSKASSVNTPTVARILPPQVHILDGVRLMDFSSLTAQEQFSRAVHEELKKTSTKNVAAIVRV